MNGIDAALERLQTIAVLVTRPSTGPGAMQAPGSKESGATAAVLLRRAHVGPRRRHRSHTLGRPGMRAHGP